jgi:SRP54-type protein, GTPase domain
VSTPGEMLGALGREARARLGNGRGGSTRVFRGRTVEELIPRIERELGPEAIVVRRREGLTGGVMGFFQHPWVEIEAVPGTAGVDLYDEPSSVEPPPLQAPDLAPPPLAPAYQPMPVPAAPPAAAMTPQSFVPPVAADLPPAAADFEPEPLFARRQPTAQPGGSAYVTAHLAALARADRAAQAPPPLVAEPPRPAPAPPPLDFHELIPEQTRRPAAPIAPPPTDWAARSTLERRTVQPGSHARARAGVEKGLARYGIGEQLAGELIDMAMAHAMPLAPRSGLAAAVRTTLAQRIPVAAPLSATGASIVLVGAGGAGKTTCCAALLEAYRTGSTLPAAFATIVREGEAGELRLLMSPQLLKPAPLESPKALRALRRARADGLAVLDTPRLSPVDRNGIRRLGRVLGELAPDRVLLALPATLGGAAAAQLLEALAPLKADGLVVTHADETDQIGVAVEAACNFGLAPEYMLTHVRAGGWRLRRLDPAGLAAMVLP